MRVFIFSAFVLISAPVLPALAQSGDPLNNSGARPGNEIGTGSSLPKSNRASHINTSDDRRQIAPNLPSPPIGDNAEPRDYLIAARNSLAAGQTGLAQQSLEMAQARLLNRSVLAAQGREPSADLQVRRIEEARQALGNGNVALARQIVDSALSP